MTNNAKSLLTEASILPEEMPENFTYRKVREILGGLESFGEDELRAAIAATERLRIRGPLASVIFIKQHLAGAHEVEVDRVDEGEEGASFAVLVYAEGEVPVPVDELPQNVTAGSLLRYEPAAGQYRQ
ncbi:MAG TPA: hypothetical protein VF658_17175 [Pyrinomonadaceae bacterium]